MLPLLCAGVRGVPATVVYPGALTLGLVPSVAMPAAVFVPLAVLGCARPVMLLINFSIIS